MSTEDAADWSVWARDAIEARVASSLALSPEALEVLASGLQVEVLSPYQARYRCEWTASELTYDRPQQPPEDFVGTAAADIVDALKEFAGRARARSVDAYLREQPT